MWKELIFKVIAAHHLILSAEFSVWLRGRNLAQPYNECFMSTSMTASPGLWSQLVKRPEIHVPLGIFSTSADASRAVAEEIAMVIRRKQQESENCVLGLATGSTPKGVYKHLVRMHREEGLSWRWCDRDTRCHYQKRSRLDAAPSGNTACHRTVDSEMFE